MLITTYFAQKSWEWIFVISRTVDVVPFFSFYYRCNYSNIWAPSSHGLSKMTWKFAGLFKKDLIAQTLQNFALLRQKSVVVCFLQSAHNCFKDKVTSCVYKSSIRRKSKQNAHPAAFFREGYIVEIFVTSFLKRMSFIRSFTKQISIFLNVNPMILPYVLHQ